MRFELMFPDQIRKAIKANWPVVLPLGVLEYHGEHSVMGVDMNKHQDEKWYSRSAKEANLAYGNAAKDKILKSVKSILAGGNEA